MLRISTVAIFATLLLVLLACGCLESKSEVQVFEMAPGLTAIDSLVGTGATVTDSSFVEIHYTGWLYVEGEKDGEPFDSSHKRNEPIAIPLGNGMVIPGWEKGLVGLKVGGKRTLIIAPEMAYGENGHPPVIPPNSTLIFDLELVSLPVVDITITEEGTGPVVQKGDEIEAHYTGWLWEDGAKGAEFDSSTKSGRPFTFAVGRGRVIPGWDLGFQGLKVGTKATFIIPSVLGYGARGAGGAIPPNADLCFEIELLSIAGK